MWSRSKGPIEMRLRVAQAAPWLAACIGYLLLGCILLPYNGIEDNESLFAIPIYGPVARDYRIRVFHQNIPLMVMDYVGALKAWIYSFIFRFCEPSPVTIRVPVLLIGTVTIGLFYRL